ncbi:MAG: hypothetical protein AB7W28_06635 [Armatimonadota bacterium]
MGLWLTRVTVLPHGPRSAVIARRRAKIVGLLVAETAGLLLLLLLGFHSHQAGHDSTHCLLCEALLAGGVALVAAVLLIAPVAIRDRGICVAVHGLRPYRAKLLPRGPPAG